MGIRVLIIPDKFKGTLTARQAAEALAAGWRAARPGDDLELAPMSDGGDGFGEVLSGLLGAIPRTARAVDAAHRPCEATWWWHGASRTAVVESARVIGLAQLPPGKYHPFELDTEGLGLMLRAAAAEGARRGLVGIGGSATNDGGFGLARALGWQFFDPRGGRLVRWTEWRSLAQLRPPDQARLFDELVVAVDVQNPLLGPAGCTRVYGPQKGLRPEDFEFAENCLGRAATVVQRALGADIASEPGAGAAGGLGFGLRAFADARLEPGFALFSAHARLEERLRAAQLVLTGEGAIDPSTTMGKGVGEVARLCREARLPCIGLCGQAVEPDRLAPWFTELHALAPGLTSAGEARAQPAVWLERLAAQVAGRFHLNAAGGPASI
jgi:glycerate kinase